jgi:hypothetical protein
MTGYTGDLLIASNDPDESQLSLSLAGVGIQPPADEPDISVNPTSLNFGEVVIGSASDQSAYLEKSLAIRPASLMAYWTLGDPSGATAQDSSPQNNDAEYKNVMLGQDGIGDGLTAAQFNGSDGWVWLWSPGLAADFDGQEGTFSLWARVSESGIWTDGAEHNLVSFHADNENFMSIRKPINNNVLQARYLAGGVNINAVNSSMTTTDWFHIAMTWSKTTDEMRFYVNGVQSDSTQTGLGTWLGQIIEGADPFKENRLGLHNNAFWSGLMAHAAVWNTPLTPSEIADLSTVEPNVSDRTLTISNLGTQNLNVSGLNSTNPVFSVVSPAPPFVVSPGTDAIVTVRFAPSEAITYTGDLQIASNDPDESQVSVPLAGTGIQPPTDEPDIAVGPTSLDFGQVVVGSNSDRTLTVSNLGTQNLNVSGLTSSNPVFSVVSPATPFNVTPGNNVLVTLRFTPAAVSTYSGNLQIASNDPDESNVSVPLSGQGISTPTVAFRINSGGANFTDSSGNLFVADKAFTAGDFGYTGGKAFTTTAAINNTTNDPLYQAQRSSSGLNPFAYVFDNLPAGNYTVILHFAEIRPNGPGQRSMDVTIEGSLLLDNYDIYVAAGGGNTAVTETFQVPVSDGQLNIDFTSTLRGTIIAAIEVVSAP